MKHRTALGRRVAAIGIGAGLVAGSVIGATAPAQAYDPNPSEKVIEVKTDKGRHLDDPIDDTTFEKDPGGVAIKIELRQDGLYLGKAEFHPRGEKLWVYDTHNDGDSAVYGKLRWYDEDKDRWVSTDFAPPSTSAEVDMDTVDFSIPDGSTVGISLYDNKARTDLIAGGKGLA